MIVRMCDSKGAFEAFPEKQIKLDLKNITKIFEVIIETPVLIIIKDKFEVSIFRDGKLLIKNCKSLEEAEEQARRVYELITRRDRVRKSAGLWSETKETE